MTAGTWDVRRFASLPSTNDWLLEQARRGAPSGLVAVADHQSAGRGRLGRRWEAPAGRALLLSVLLRPVAPLSSLFACTAAAALSLSEACAEVVGEAPGVKWPNDLVYPALDQAEGVDRKVAGILAESDASAPGGRPGSVAVVVGMGCNVDWEGPPGAGGTSLMARVRGQGAAHVRGSDAHSAARQPVSREALLSATLERLAARVAALDTPEGRRATVADLRRRCVTLGRRVRVEAAGLGTLTGVAESLDDDGRLVVSSAGGAVVVAAGDVVHLRTAVGEHG